MKQEISNRRKTEKIHMWKFMYLWTTDGSKKKAKEKLGNILRQQNKTRLQNLQDEVKAMLRQKFIVVNAYNKKEERF